MVNGQQVWNSLQNDSHLKGQEYLYPVLKPMVEAIPEILGDDLQKPVSAETLVRGRMKFVRYCLEHDFIKDAVEAMPEDAFGFFGKDGMGEMMEAALTSLVSFSEGFLEDVMGFLKDSGLTDEQVVLSPKTGLNAEMREKYTAGGMTMEDLMIGQPGVIVLENNS